MHQISDDGLLAANATFYDALERGDFESMKRTWAHDGDVMCAHPGRVSVWGWPDVSESWRLIFESGGNPQIIITDERVVRRGSMGWVTVTENLISGGHTGAASAVNLFEYRDDHWMMVGHHAGAVIA